MLSYSVEYLAASSKMPKNSGEFVNGDNAAYNFPALKSLAVERQSCHGPPRPLSTNSTGSSSHASSVSSRQTPSPASSTEDSGILSDTDVANTLLSLEKLVSRPKPSDSNEKPSHSYIALISMAILSSPQKKMLLGDIYQYIMDNFRYFNNQAKAWRNSIRHNLSLNECFVKNGRSDNGKGHYWSIHPACLDDFSSGDFRRRQARRRAKRAVRDHEELEQQPARHPTCPLTTTASLPAPGYGHYNVGYVPMSTVSMGSNHHHHPYIRNHGNHPMQYQPPATYGSYQNCSSSNTYSSPYITACAYDNMPAPPNNVNAFVDKKI